MTAEEPAVPPNLGIPFGAAMAAAGAAADLARAAAGAVAECVGCKRSQFDAARERERAEHLYLKYQALEADHQAMAARLAVLEATDAPLAITLGDTVRRLQLADVTQRRNIALAETYVTELQQFIRVHCQAEPPSLMDAEGWRRNKPDTATF